MMELLRFNSSICVSCNGENKSSWTNRNPNISCFCSNLESFCFIAQRKLQNSICTVFSPFVSMIGRSFLVNLNQHYVMRRRCIVVHSRLHSCSVVKVDDDLVVLDEQGNKEYGVNVFCEKLDGSVPSSCLQRKFSRSELKVYFLEERDEEVLSKRILNLSRSNKVRSALELFLSMNFSGLIASAHACNSLLACLVRNRSIDDVLLVFEMMRKKGLPTCHTYSLVFKAVAGAKGFKIAMEMFMSLEDEGVFKHTFNIVVYNTMISICVKTKNWGEIEKMWRKFKQNDLSGSMITYSLLITGFVQCGNTELAINAYHEMITSGLEPDEDIMKAIVASCTKDGKWAFALNIVRKMLIKGIKPSLIAYNSLITCLGKAGKDDLAFRVYEQLKLSGHTPDVYTWSALLGTLYTSKRYADVLSKFESYKAMPVCQLNFQLYNIALMSCQRLGLWEHSLQLVWEMEESGMEMSTVSYNHVIRACETARKPEIALQVYQHMINQNHTPDTFTYLSLIRACFWGSLWSELENISKCSPLDASIYNAFVQGFCLRGKSLLAKQMYRKMHSIGLEPDGQTRAMMLQLFSADEIKQDFSASL